LDAGVERKQRMITKQHSARKALQVTGQFKIEQEEWTTAEDIQALYSPEDLDGPSISE